MKFYLIATEYKGNIYYFANSPELTNDIKKATHYDTKIEADIICHNLNIKNSHNFIMQVGEAIDNSKLPNVINLNGIRK
jgi:hypothetical protein